MVSSIVELLNEESLKALDFSGPWMWYLVGLYLLLPIIFYIILPFLMSPSTKTGTKTISIFVLGDLGHSPRMCLHAKSFANLEYSVNLCGYLESELSTEFVDNPWIEVYDIPVIRNSKNLPFLLFAVEKMVLQFFHIFQRLFEFRGSDYIMIQNPPSIPILLIVLVFIKLFSRHTKLIVDWHNLNYSILDLRFQNEKHPLVKFLKMYEKYLGRFSDLNITVTKGLKQYLVQEFGLKDDRTIVLYDRPGDQFNPLDKLEYTKDEIILHEAFKDVDKSIDYKILVSSTSFTPDEDFNVLLDALKLYDESNLETPLLVIVTGKGPMKAHFLETIKLKKFLSKVVVKSVWLAIEDYPIIMAVADLAISLHTSSSGLDLPMKILDFFGCGIPVISLNFSCISELVNHNTNGLITQNEGNNEKQTNASEVHRLLELALTNQAVYTTIKQGAMAESQLRWNQNWNRTLQERFKYRR